MTIKKHQFKRHVVNKIINNIDSDDIFLITGARQVGKTTILKQIQASIAATHLCDFINLEKMDILAELNQNPLNLLKMINFNNQTQQKHYIFVDEIQYLKNPTNFLKLIYDEYKGLIKLIVSGSSSFYIDKKFKDSLAGRKKIYELGTLNFQEFLEFKQENQLADFINNNQASAQKQDISLLNKKQLEHVFEEFMVYGSYPKVVLTQNIQEKKEILSELANAYVKKDAEDAGVEGLDNFYKLCRALAGLSSQILNVNKLNNLLGITSITLKRYMHILQKSFLVSSVKPFSNNLLKEIIKMPKIFFMDTGLRNYFVNNFNALNSRLDKGALLENVCFKMFKDKLDLDNIQYWHTQDGHEVDFIINRSMAFEVKFLAQLFDFKKYQSFTGKYPDIKLNLLTLGQHQDKAEYYTRPAYLI